MSAGHQDRSRVESTAFDLGRSAWEPGQTVGRSDDAAATVPRRCRGCTLHQKQLFGFQLPRKFCLCAVCLSGGIGERVGASSDPWMRLVLGTSLVARFNQPRYWLEEPCA